MGFSFKTHIMQIRMKQIVIKKSKTKRARRTSLNSVIIQDVFSITWNISYLNNKLNNISRYIHIFTTK
jgi:hypothetical protein